MTIVYTTWKMIIIVVDNILLISYQIYSHCTNSILFITTSVMICWQKVILGALDFIVSLFQIQYIAQLVKFNNNSLISLGGTDLASGKPTSSSSVLGDLKPQLAVDSNPSPDSHKKSCFFSSFEDHPWWSVDLGHAVSVRSVTVTTRNKAGNHNCIYTLYWPIRYRLARFVFSLFDSYTDIF